MRRAALPVALACLALAWAAPAPAQAFGLASFSAQATEHDASLDNTAGSHPYELSVAIGMRTEGSGGATYPEGDLRGLRLELPAGMAEDPRTVGKCTQAEFHAQRESPYEESLSGESCRLDSQVGTLAVRTSLGGGETRTFGLFSLVPSPGTPYQLGAAPFGVPIVLTPRLRDSQGEFGVTLEARNLSQAVPIEGLEATVWGTPWDESHDGQRGNCLNEAESGSPWAQCSSGFPVLVPPQEYTEEPKAQAYLSLPASCAAPLAYSVQATSWQGQSAAASTEGPLLKGCEHLSFLTFPTAQLTNGKASSPSGFAFGLQINQEGIVNPSGTIQPQMKEAVVSLPEGVTIDPSMAAGLGVCTPAQYAAASATDQGCPNGSEIGEFAVRSPLLEGPLEGAIFLAQPYQNPFGSIVAVYMVARSPERGVAVKLAGQLDPDPATGRITARFDGLPQLPYSSLEVHFREGQRAPLVTPSACGQYATRIDLHPWLAPQVDVAQTAYSTVREGIGGGACPSGAVPFNPLASGGSLNSAAGAYSPFYLHLTRTDTEAEITSYSATLPPGLLGNLNGIPYCPDAAIEAAKQMSGTAEAANPPCPAASRVGRTYAGYGLGGVLAYAPGQLYLAGPYHGSPLSIVAIDPALVGPFDLGVIVVRSALHIDPLSAQVSIDSAGSDPIPHIKDGIPLHLRDIRIYIDRPGFTLNPTGCEASTLSSTMTGSAPPFADPFGDTASATVRYQASDCSALGFKPALSIRLRGRARRGGNPALRAVVRERSGDANIGAATVALPRTEFLAQSHLRGICAASLFAKGQCPSYSVYGSARAFTPLLPAPLEGPVYLVSSHRKLPDLVAALAWNGIAIDVVGHIGSAKGGGMKATFEGLPDGPASRFVMALRGGRHSLLENEVNICKTRTFASARFTGQNGGAESMRVPLLGSCAKHRRKHSRHTHKKGGRR